MRILSGIIIALALCVASPAFAWDIRHAVAVNQSNFKQMAAPAYDLLTDTYGERQGNLIMTPRGKIWCSLPIYAGDGYVVIPSTIGPTVVRIERKQYAVVYKMLVSRDHDEIQNALGLIDGSAYLQGLIELPDFMGD